MADAILTDNVHVADGRLKRLVGLTPRRSIPEDYALVFEYGERTHSRMHTYWTPFDLRVVWVCDDTVTANEVLEPRSHAQHTADTVVEMHPALGREIQRGDDLRITQHAIYDNGP